jgi:hypothetical protein
MRNLEYQASCRIPAPPARLLNTGNYVRPAHSHREHIFNHWRPPKLSHSTLVTNPFLHHHSNAPHHSFSVHRLHLRRSTSLHTLWIDALSIDQPRITERSTAVANVLWIYRTAVKVVAWLSPPFQSAGSFLETVRKVVALPMFEALDQVMLNTLRLELTGAGGLSHLARKTRRCISQS